MSKSALVRGLTMITARQDIFLAVMLLVAVFMMILPLPTTMVDLLIAINLAFSVILLMISIYLRDPLEFSVFPSLLLITTLYRLALTISTTRLVLLQHDAGEIVEAFGQFVVGGNLAVGMIIFTIITVVQFIVITKGSERVAEVSARFSLDGMPGKQMSIDGDMRAGAIDSVEAKRLRERVQKESRLFGAMDGAMKFVKGDAIAGIIVILVNIIGGITIGVMQHKMSAEEAMNTYAVLSIGDGLCAQIPSLLISITAGIIVTRVPGSNKQSLANELAVQVGRQPDALWLAAAILTVFALLPGFPFLIFITLAAAVAAPAFLLYRKNRRISQDGRANGGGEEGAATGQRMTPGAVPLMLHCASNLHHPHLGRDIDGLRWRWFEHLGVPLPEVEIRCDPTLAENTLSVQVYQERVLEVVLPPDSLLLTRPCSSLVTNNQVLGAKMGSFDWLDAKQAMQARTLGIPYVEGHQRIITCLTRVFERYTAEFIGVQETRYLMDAMEGRYGELVKELQRQIPVGKVAEILQRLVEENISIRDLRTIFGALVVWAPKEKDIVMLTEYVRIALRRHLCRRFSHNKTWISVLRLGDGVEHLIRDSIRQTSSGTYSALEERRSLLILNKIKNAFAENQDAVLLTTLDVRRFVRKIIERDLFVLPVLSWQELGDEMNLKVAGTIELIGDELDETA
ncbi:MULTISPECIES: EscV/YscV/HrcV family type III secretion system export apparatus protein [Yersinia pseudotuberculosis complex]|uniref:EscV/YscV/HrcV family type III secretion system export apparatus protein n=3 Tax=Yersinia pseudotuberculosis TaxID=633 RepID=A0ABM7AF69_YERPU|nr:MULTISPECIES: EscV/YscV/HrcV family type III secretion system export apparatus protein [Yersinia pseudotuberculosis complex]ABS47095.1 type III secretion protein, HrcV family [Yersinia pseudotuberculosis IP 31758]AIN15149.1 type III secretion, HrcV family protein [Yersinia pseudotuberculosis]AJJ05523.1 type III secretion, HrcV family protein [Yersinia pseudotuberculosis]AJJ60215.1 type III secretion, HrcV family protein [Yersinia pseudotuberculosis YPIII]AYW85836.1 EscV/YscV/HrcV family typ